MNPKPITPDQSAALQAAGDQPLSLIDEATQHVYVVVDIDVHEQAMKALRLQQNVNAIREGVADMEAGRHYSLE